MSVVPLKRNRFDEDARTLLQLPALLGKELRYTALKAAFDSILPDQPAEPPSKEEFDKGVNLAIALLYEAARHISMERPVITTEIRS
ncbi:MAG: hypothetical protein AAB480_03470 [Patescibacteria group bacterium]